MNTKKSIIRYIVYAVLVLSFSAFDNSVSEEAIQNTAFKRGELLSYRLHYGVINAGVATIGVDKDLSRVNRKDCYKIEVKGKSTGTFGKMMHIKDTWRSYIDTSTLTPERFHRDIAESKYRLKETMYINKRRNEIEVHQKKPDKDTKVKTYDVPEEVHDIVSGYYYLRNINYSKLKENDIISLKAFLEDELYDFEMRYKGKDVVKTKLGRVNAIKLVPIMPENGLFSGEDAITVWLSDDGNHIPLVVEAQMYVGAVKLNLNGYKNLRYPLNTAD